MYPFFLKISSRLLGKISLMFKKSFNIMFRSEDPTRRQNVENFILSRLSQLTSDTKSPDEEAGKEPHSHSKCADLVRSIEDSLECPVCRDRVHGEVSSQH